MSIVEVGHQVAVVLALGVRRRREHGLATDPPTAELDRRSLAGFPIVFEEWRRRHSSDRP